MTAARALEFAPLQQPQRDYTSDREVIRCADGLRFILRTVERDACGVAQAVLYTAWEPADANPYSMKRAGPGGKLWGRADTRTYDGSPVELYGRQWTGEHAPIYWGFQQQHRARELIRATCPETREGYERPDGISLAYVRAPERPLRLSSAEVTQAGFSDDAPLQLDLAGGTTR